MQVIITAKHPKHPSPKSTAKDAMTFPQFLEEKKNPPQIEQPKCEIKDF